MTPCVSCGVTDVAGGTLELRIVIEPPLGDSVLAVDVRHDIDICTMCATRIALGSVISGRIDIEDHP